MKRGFFSKLCGTNAKQNKGELILNTEVKRRQSDDSTAVTNSVTKLTFQADNESHLFYKAISNIHHSAIAKVYSYEERPPSATISFTSNHDCNLWTSILDYVRLRKLVSEGDIIPIVYQIVDIIHTLHSHNIIHFSINPGAFGMDANNRLVLKSFQTAKFVSDNDVYSGESLNPDKLWVSIAGDILSKPHLKSSDLKSIDAYQIGALIFLLLKGYLPQSQDSIRHSNLSAPARDFILALMTFNCDERYFNWQCVKEQPWIRPSAHHSLQGNATPRPQASASTMETVVNVPPKKSSFITGCTPMALSHIRDASQQISPFALIVDMAKTEPSPNTRIDAQESMSDDDSSDGSPPSVSAHNAINPLAFTRQGGNHSGSCFVPFVSDNDGNHKKKKRAQKKTHNFVVTDGNSSPMFSDNITVVSSQVDDYMKGLQSEQERLRRMMDPEDYAISVMVGTPARMAGGMAGSGLTIDGKSGRASFSSNASSMSSATSIPLTGYGTTHTTTPSSSCGSPQGTQSVGSTPSNVPAYEHPSPSPQAGSGSTTVAGSAAASQTLHTTQPTLSIGPTLPNKYGVGGASMPLPHTQLSQITEASQSSSRDREMGIDEWDMHSGRHQKTGLSAISKRVDSRSRRHRSPTNSVVSNTTNGSGRKFTKPSPLKQKPLPPLPQKKDRSRSHEIRGGQRRNIKISRSSRRQTDESTTILERVDVNRRCSHYETNDKLPVPLSMKGQFSSSASSLKDLDADNRPSPKHKPLARDDLQLAHSQMNAMSGWLTGALASDGNDSGDVPPPPPPPPPPPTQQSRRRAPPRIKTAPLMTPTPTSNRKMRPVNLSMSHHSCGSEYDSDSDSDSDSNSDSSAVAV